MLNRLDMYLNWGMGDEAYYVNTETEEILVNKFQALYTVAKAARDSLEEAKPDNLEKWRKAYKGVLGALKQDGTESKKRGRQLRKLAYEIVESKIDNSLPMPKMKPRYKSDLYLVDATESYLKFEADRTLTKDTNDKNERQTYIDGTSWYKVCWDSLDRTHERSGDIRIETRRVDEIVPQPDVSDYRQLEYIFERQRVSTTKLYDLYGRLIRPDTGESNTVSIVSCYYLNEDRIVGLFTWAEYGLQVICNEHDWQIRKLRTCDTCGEVNPIADRCGRCGSTSFHFENAQEEILAEDLYQVVNPLSVSQDNTDNNGATTKELFLAKGTKIPYYVVRQLPFVPRPAVSSIDSLYGISEVMMVLEMQDVVNKLYTKAADKTFKSGTVVTKPEKMKISDTDDTFKVMGVKTVEEANMVQSKQVMADTSQDLVLAATLYDSAKSSSGITDSFQGKKDTTATSGKAKMYSVAQSAGRIESLRVMKAAAFSGVYELVLKYLLAFSDEKRKFVKVLPGGEKVQMTWNKYMFLDKDEYGNVFYRDDFQFDSDPAATLSQNRQEMWQETIDKFIQGAMGNVTDPRTLKLFWYLMDEFQYPLAKLVLTGIENNEQHLPPELEQAIMQNPQLLQQLMQMLDETTSGQGGARPNSGPTGSGATHAALVEGTNQRNRAANRETATSAQQAVGGASV